MNIGLKCSGGTTLCNYCQWRKFVYLVSLFNNVNTVLVIKIYE